jgi:hypothetical protein
VANGCWAQPNRWKAFVQKVFPSKVASLLIEKGSIFSPRPKSKEIAMNAIFVLALLLADEPEKVGRIGMPLIEGDVEVSLESAGGQKVRLKNIFGDSTTSKEDLFVVKMRVTNLNDSKKYQFESWEDSATCHDDLGNRYARINFGATVKVIGREESASLYPNKPVADVLVFELPIDKAKEFYIKLPAKNTGIDSERIFTFKLVRLAQGSPESKQETKTAAPTPPPKSQAQIDAERKAEEKAAKAKREIEAAEKLRLAKATKKAETRTKWLREVIEKFPGTKAASEAATLLTEEKGG